MENKICPRCSVDFGCGANTGDCWCKALPVAKIVPGIFTDCFCPTCLVQLQAQAQAQAPLQEGEDYYTDPTGLLVFTKTYLKKRGYCCKNGCKNCPY